VTRMHPLMVASATEDRHPAVIDTDHLRPSQISRFTAQEVPSEYDRKDSVLNPALVQYNYPAGPGGQTSVEFAINPPKVREAFAGDLSELQIALIGVTQRPIAAAAFSDASGPPAWKKLRSWAVVATGDKAVGADLALAHAQRAGADIIEVEGSHVIMISQPQVVADHIMKAARAVADSPR
jgi:hypothetical protein